ncbi:MAG: sugar phosphate isomerase/epimerase [Prolixibacteraceae bacterium]|nr:sugar phosphate isomerase/epimerase [Prolixibacteraceae bacterium]
MKKIDRRNFIRTTSAGIATACILPLSLSACGKQGVNFGFQSWTIRQQLAEDFAGTMKKMAGYGYSEIEMCSPKGYTGTEFETFTDMAPSEMKNIINDSGLICRSSHYNFAELKETLDDTINWTLKMGIEQIILSSFWLPEGSMDEYRKACGELNVIAEKVNNAGLVTGYHNHHMEFEKRDGELIYDVLMKELNPDLVKMQFQVAVISIGYKAADYFRKYPGRFVSAHLADWSTEKEAQVPIGQGVVDWNEFFEAAKTGGVKNFFVEMDPATFKESAEFLKSL